MTARKSSLVWRAPSAGLLREASAPSALALGAGKKRRSASPTQAEGWDVSGAAVGRGR